MTTILEVEIIEIIKVYAHQIENTDVEKEHF